MSMVMAVLDQLLDDRRRPLDHLAGGDLRRQLIGQHVNHGLILAERGNRTRILWIDADFRG